MKVLGIIAEYNPLHNGHQYQLQEGRLRSEADYVIVLMSPDFVQRGEPALLDKWVRARMALDAGADLVLELPVRYAVGSAEFFASGGVSVLSSLGVVDALSFGCEADQVDPLKEYACFLSEKEPEEYQTLLQNHLRKGMSYAEARCLSYLTYTGKEDPLDLLRSPNNILAVEYMKAIHLLRTKMEIIPVKRTGAGYHEKTTVSGNGPVYASATGIRHALANGKDVSDLMPQEAFHLLSGEIALNRYLNASDLDVPLHLALYKNRSSLTEFVDVSEDLANRIDNLLIQYTGFEQFTSLIKTRQMAYTRVQRALLHILLGLKNKSSKNEYARVLGFRKEAAPLLHEIKQHSSIPLITKLPSDHEIPEGLSEDLDASLLWEMLVCHKTGAPVRNERQRRIVTV